VINGKVKAAGNVPSKGTIKEWLLEIDKRARSV